MRDRCCPPGFLLGEVRSSFTAFLTDGGRKRPKIDLGARTIAFPTRDPISLAGRNGNRFDRHEIITPRYFEFVTTNSYGARASRAASNIRSITRSGAVSIGVWSASFARTLAPMRLAMKRCVSG